MTPSRKWDKLGGSSAPPPPGPAIFSFTSHISVCLLTLYNDIYWTSESGFDDLRSGYETWNRISERPSNKARRPMSRRSKVQTILQLGGKKSRDIVFYAFKNENCPVGDSNIFEKFTVVALEIDLLRWLLFVEICDQFCRCSLLIPNFTQNYTRFSEWHSS